MERKGGIMAKAVVCDFCLAEGKGFFHKPERLADGHHVCKNCKSIIQSYKLPVKYDIFQTLVTAQPNMVDMIMGAYLENHQPDETVAKFYPLPATPLHEGEHCINGVKATLVVDPEEIPEEAAIKEISKIRKKNINNISDYTGSGKGKKITGTLYETEAAIYFMSDNFINCHRLGYVKRNTGDNDRIIVQTPHRSFTYKIENADLFFLRERFFQKVSAAKHNKTQHLIYIKGENEVTITPGVYDIPKALKPGRYKVKAINDAGLHMRDSLGRIKDYYETEDAIDLDDGGVLECTGEYELQWIGESEDE